VREVRPPFSPSAAGPAVKAQVMSDSEMDKVTAGASSHATHDNIIVNRGSDHFEVQLRNNLNCHNRSC
jgi:hypothetical protein